MARSILAVVAAVGLAATAQPETVAALLGLVVERTRAMPAHWEVTSLMLDRPHTLHKSWLA